MSIWIIHPLISTTLTSGWLTVVLNLAIKLASWGNNVFISVTIYDIFVPECNVLIANVWGLGGFFISHSKRTHLSLNLCK